MKNLSRLLSVLLWSLAMVIAWNERKSAQARSARSQAPTGSQPSQDTPGAEAGSQGTAPGEPPMSGAGVDAGTVSRSSGTGAPAGDADDSLDAVATLAGDISSSDHSPEDFSATSSLPDDETNDAPADSGSGPAATASVGEDDAGASPREAAAGLPQSGLTGGEERRATPGGADASGPANSVPGTGTAACPDGYPVKGNATSRIYHLPGESSYERTVPEVCFASAEDAVAAGFRPRKQ